MPDKMKLKVLFAAAEAAPLVKVGGLADVVGSLPRALQKEGIEVKTVIPLHGSIDPASFEEYPVEKTLNVITMGKPRKARLFRYKNNEDSPVFLLEGGEYFPRPQVYGYDDDLERFLFFSRAIPLIPDLLSWQPDIIHLHDWHSATIPMWAKSYGRKYSHVFTMHNLAYKGLFDLRFTSASELGKLKGMNWKKTPENKMSMLSQGILHSDVINTVSPNYAKEILTPEFGEGLESLLKQRKDNLFGILNGIDIEEYNPAQDPYLAHKYDISSLPKRTANKSYLQEKLGLQVKPQAPLLGMVTRLDEQKGLDLLEKSLEQIFEKSNIQIVILGKGRENYQKMLSAMVEKYPGRLSLTIDFNNSLAHSIYGGCDIFLMPSLFEPCGLGQLIAMRYGAIPLVSAVGGLVDTVFELSPEWERGRGFVFKPYEPAAFIATVGRAITAYQDKNKWSELMQTVMAQDFSWKASAKKYINLYKLALKNKSAGQAGSLPESKRKRS